MGSNRGSSLVPLILGRENEFRLEVAVCILDFYNELKGRRLHIFDGTSLLD